jgi:hypothetical protein
VLRVWRRRRDLRASNESALEFIANLNQELFKLEHDRLKHVDTTAAGVLAGCAASGVLLVTVLTEFDPSGASLLSAWLSGAGLVGAAIAAIGARTPAPGPLSWRAIRQRRLGKEFEENAEKWAEASERVGSSDATLDRLRPEDDYVVLREAALDVWRSRLERARLVLPNKERWLTLSLALLFAGVFQLGYIAAAGLLS